MSTKLIPWESAPDITVTSAIPIIIRNAPQLRDKDKRTIISAFTTGEYLMVSTFVWDKAMNSLKSQLSKLGLTFISEMLDRPDISEYSNILNVISNYDAIYLAEQLGILTDTGSLRLKRALELINHYNNPEKEISEEDDFSKGDAEEIVRTSIQSILSHQNVEFALDFKKFRSSLENDTLDKNSIYIERVVSSPYFFLRATVRVILAIIKGSNGAQLENSLANANLIIPLIWDNLNKPEKFQIGRLYAECVNDGKTIAASGIRQVLLKVKGFDFVPEDLRSSSFSKVANEILVAHYNNNNFYNEPAPVKQLAAMGSVIPINAFPICMTALLCVRIGNIYGKSFSAQEPSLEIMKKVKRERWLYYFNEVLPNDEKILIKLRSSKLADEWSNLIMNISGIPDFKDSIKNKKIKQLIDYSLKGNKSLRINSLAEELYKEFKT